MHWLPHADFEYVALLNCRKSGEKCVAYELVYIEAEKKDTSKRKRGELGALKLQGINMHKLGMNFVKEVTDVSLGWSGTDTKRTQQGDQLQFQGVTVVRVLMSSKLKEAKAWADERLVKKMAA
jgi:hypothetical protein